jgi:hypothetical protein
LWDRHLLQLPIGLEEGCRPGSLGVAEMPEDAAIDNGGPIPLLRETVAVLLIGQEIAGQW